MPILAGMKARVWAPPVETWIFTDIDGVLNIEIDDPGRELASFDNHNINRAFEQADLPMRPRKGGERGIAQRVIATYHQECEEDGVTYGQFAADSNTGVCDDLVVRFAELVRAAGKRRKVFLTSDWGSTTKSARLVRVLEKAISRRMGEEFAFEKRAPPTDAESVKPADRLRAIGDVLAKGGASSSLRVLVLDDFYASAISAWKCKGYTVNRAEDAEMYLQDRTHGTAVVKVIHTYHEWMEAGGWTMRIGSGLTAGHFLRAHAFLADRRGASPGCAEGVEPPLDDEGMAAPGCKGIFSLLRSPRMSHRTIRPPRLSRPRSNSMDTSSCSSSSSTSSTRSSPEPHSPCSVTSL